MWSGTVGLTGPQGISEGHQEEASFVTQSLVVVVVVVVWGGPRGSSPLPRDWWAHQSRVGETRTLGGNLPKSWDEGPGRMFFPAAPRMGQFDLQGKSPPSPSWVVVKGGGVFSLLALEDEAAEHEGGNRGLRDRDRDPRVDGDRQEGSWTPVVPASSQVELSPRRPPPG